MDLTFSKEQEAWRREVRAFFAAEPPESFPTQGADLGWGFGAWSYEFARRMGDKGWISLCWPEEFGGKARPIMDRLILWEEIAYHRAPAGAIFSSIGYAATLLDLGSPRLKKELLPGIAAGEISTWMALSEPDAGTDLLALQTRAEEDGDDFVLNGQKIWSSNAHLADYGFVLAKTDPNAPRGRGLSSFVVDKRDPGVTIEPLYTLAGEHYHNLVFFDDVRVPRDYLVGEKNRGLGQIFASLDIDRFWGRWGKPALMKRVLEELVEYAGDTKSDGRPLLDDDLVRRQLADIAVQTEVARALYWWAAGTLISGERLDQEASLAKLLADESWQRILRIAMQLLGPYGQLEPDSKWAPLQGTIERYYLHSVGHTLAGGTSEVIRNTIATRGLGLPRS